MEHHEKLIDLILGATTAPAELAAAREDARLDCLLAVDSLGGWKREHGCMRVQRDEMAQLDPPRGARRTLTPNREQTMPSRTTMNIQDPTHGDPGQWTPAQTARLAAALERIERSVDALGHPIDKGIARAVAMLNELGINTQGSCEGHVGWATGGPYIDIVSKRYRAMKNESRAMKDDPPLARPKRGCART